MSLRSTPQRRRRGLAVGPGLVERRQQRELAALAADQAQAVVHGALGQQRGLADQPARQPAQRRRRALDVHDGEGTGLLVWPTTYMLVYQRW